MRWHHRAGGLVFVLGMSTGALAQQASSPGVKQLTTSPPDTIRLVTTSFTEPTRPENSAFSRSLGGCISIFDRALSLYAYDHPPDLTPAHDTLMREERRWFPYPAEAIAAARGCYHSVYPTVSAVADADIPALWPLILAMNEDSLAQVLVTRWLRLVGPDSDARAKLLGQVVQTLMNNAGPDGSGGTHLTDAHIALAQRYLGQLRAMGPSQILEWLHARNAFQNAGGWRLDSDANIQAAIDDEQQALTAMRAASPSVLSGSDLKQLHENISSTRIYGIQRLTYLKSLDREDLRRFVQSVDSVYKRPWLLGTYAPQLSADYWFGTPSNVSSNTPTSMPAPNTVSLIVFISPASGKPATTSVRDAMLRRLHAKYPALQIILMTVTTGVWANESLLDHPDREAQLMYHYVHDSLQVPGIMGVLAGKQRMVTTDGKTLPVQLPLLDRYMLDVSGLNGQLFLVDRDGIVVDQGMSLVPVIPRLLVKSSRP